MSTDLKYSVLSSLISNTWMWSLANTSAFKNPEIMASHHPNNTTLTGCHHASSNKPNMIRVQHSVEKKYETNKAKDCCGTTSYNNITSKPTSINRSFSYSLSLFFVLFPLRLFFGLLERKK